MTLQTPDKSFFGDRDPMGKRFPMVLVMAALVLWPGASPATPLQIESADVIVDQAGRRLTLSDGFHRIISLYGAHTENLFSLGLDPEIIGVTRHEDYPPAALKKPVFSQRDDPEKFLAARPDLVLVRPMLERAYGDLIRRLERSGITVASFQPATVEQMLLYWKALGMLTGRSDAAQQMVKRFQGAVNGFKTLTDDLPPKDRKRVYFEAIHDKMKTFSPDAMAIYALTAAGGINVAPDATPSRGTNVAIFGKERILARADIIDVFLAQYGAMNRPRVEQIRNEPGFHIIKAVQENRIYIVDERIVSRPTMRLLDGIFQIGTLLYPERFENRARKILDDAKSSARSGSGGLG